MQAIVADTTPLNYLVLIQAADILPKLYRTVLIPPAVKAELAHANTPAIVRAWIGFHVSVQQPPCGLRQWFSGRRQFQERCGGVFFGRLAHPLAT